MKKPLKVSFFLLVILLASFFSEAKPMRTVVFVETDYITKWKNPNQDYYNPENISMVFDLSSRDYGLSHGTGVLSAFFKTLNVNKVNPEQYQVVVIKYEPYSNNNQKSYLNALRTLKTVAKLYNVDIINLSLEGEDFLQEECRILKDLLDESSGLSVVAAAGNSRNDNSKKKIYPADCDQRIFKVLNHNGKTLGLNSNYYSFKNTPNVVREDGNFVKVASRDQYNVVEQTGTSVAAGIYSAKKLIELLNKGEK